MRGDSVHLENFWGRILSGVTSSGGNLSGGIMSGGIISVPPKAYMYQLHVHRKQTQRTNFQQMPMRSFFFINILILKQVQ